MKDQNNWTIRATNGAITTKMSNTNIQRYAQGSNAYCVEVCDNLINIRSNVDNKFLVSAIRLNEKITSETESTLETAFNKSTSKSE
jgi:hypothetical protein